MEMGKTLRELVGDTSFLDTLYGWVYNRAYNRGEVDDIVHDIVIALLVASQYHDTDYTYAYVWKTAENVHANHERKKYRSSRNVQELDEFCVNTSVSLHDDSFEEKLIGRIVDADMYEKIMRETAFLSKIYRDVMVMYYFHELPVAEIAKRLDIPENRVKQRLFSAREKIKNNLSGKVLNGNKMNTNTMIQPYQMSFCGSGNPMETAIYKGFSRSMFEQNIVIACRDKAKTPSEIASETGIPTAYVENALNNMSDEIIKKCGDDKYIANILVVDAKVRKEANAIMEKVASDYVGDVLENWIYANGNDKKILETLDKSGVQHPLEYILWSVIPRIADQFEYAIENDVIKSFDNVEKDVREYYVLATYHKPDERDESDVLYGWNGQGWSDKNVARFSDFTGGKRFGQSVNRFYAAYDASPELMMAYKVKGGFKISEVSEDDRAAVSRAEELGYIKKDGDKYYPNMLMEKDGDIATFSSAKEVWDTAKKYAGKCSDDIKKLAEKYVPKHMYMHMKFFIGNITGSMRHYVIEEAIKRGALYQPEPTGTEGIWCTIKE